MTVTTSIVLIALLGVAVVGSLLLLLGHSIHADRFMHRAEVRHLPQPERERIAA